MLMIYNDSESSVYLILAVLLTQKEKYVTSVKFDVM